MVLSGKDERLQIRAIDSIIRQWWAPASTDASPENSFIYLLFSIVSFIWSYIVIIQKILPRTGPGPERRVGPADAPLSTVGPAEGPATSVGPAAGPATSVAAAAGPATSAGAARCPARRAEGPARSAVGPATSVVPAWLAAVRAAHGARSPLGAAEQTEAIATRMVWIWNFKKMLYFLSNNFKQIMSLM